MQSWQIEKWRESVLQSTLWAALVLASVAYVPGVWAAMAMDLSMLVLLDTLAWIGVAVLALGRRLGYMLRAATFVILWAAFALILLWQLGPAGAGILWLSAVPVLAALFFGYPGALIGIASLSLLAAGVFVLLLADVPADFLPASNIGYTAASWGGSAGSLLFISMLISLALSELLRRLEKSLTQLNSRNHELLSIMQERESLQEQILRSQKQSALSTMVAGITHDFNNLLLPIVLASERARDLTECDSPVRGELDLVLRSAERARELVRRLLNLNQPTKSDYPAVHVTPLIEDVNLILRSSVPATVCIRTELPEHAVWVRADSDELHQIFLNLGTNACLAMPEGGELVWRLFSADANGIVHIEVSDTGYGISQENQMHIFDPFFTTRQPGGGSGLGLSIVNRLISNMQGSIEVESELGRGSSFHLYLPGGSEDVLAHESGNEEAGDELDEPGPAQILVVDDEDMVRGTLVAVLSRAGYQVSEASRAEHALALIADPASQFHLLITDLSMPDVNGIELAQRVRALPAAIPIIVTTGYFSDSHRLQLSQLSDSLLLPKPYLREELLGTVRKALALGRD